MIKIKPTNYIGYHVGDVDDEYIASPEHPDWDNVWNNADHLEIDRGCDGFFVFHMILCRLCNSYIH